MFGQSLWPILKQNLRGGVWDSLILTNCSYIGIYLWGCICAPLVSIRASIKIVDQSIGWVQDGVGFEWFGYDLKE